MHLCIPVYLHSTPLTIFLIRVNDSDYISLSEKEVGNIALNIEKAIYNMFLSTDNRYKNKYRLILFNLKDPVNKVSSVLLLFLTCQRKELIFCPHYTSADLGVGGGQNTVDNLLVNTY